MMKLQFKNIPIPKSEKNIRIFLSNIGVEFKR